MFVYITLYGTGTGAQKSIKTLPSGEEMSTFIPISTCLRQMSLFKNFLLVLVPVPVPVSVCMSMSMFTCIIMCTVSSDETEQSLNPNNILFVLAIALQFFLCVTMCL